MRPPTNVVRNCMTKRRQLVSSPSGAVDQACTRCSIEGPSELEIDEVDWRAAADFQHADNGQDGCPIRKRGPRREDSILQFMRRRNQRAHKRCGKKELHLL